MECVLLSALGPDILQCFYSDTTVRGQRRDISKVRKTKSVGMIHGRSHFGIRTLLIVHLCN